MVVKVQLLHEELERAGLPVFTVYANGQALYIRDLTLDEEALASQVIAAHDPNSLTPAEQDEADAESTVVSFRELPQWAIRTPQQAEDYVQSNVLNGWEAAAANTWIDANVSDLASAKTALKMLAAAIISIRAILKTIARAIIYFRIIVIRRS